MKKLILVAMASMSLASCGLPTLITGVPPAPVAVANQTILDEKVGIAVETAYKAWRLAVELAVDTNLLKGEKAARVAEIDQKMFEATLLVQAAYKVGNANQYASAAREANDLIKQGIALMREK